MKKIFLNGSKINEVNRQKLLTSLRSVSGSLSSKKKKNLVLLNLLKSDMQKGKIIFSDEKIVPIEAQFNPRNGSVGQTLRGYF